VPATLIKSEIFQNGEFSVARFLTELYSVMIERENARFDPDQIQLPAFVFHK
jgi:hypothetical protein